MKNFFLMRSIQAKIVIWASLCMLIPLAIVITFSVMAESDIGPILPEYPVIVSLCGKARDAMYVPDNGYELPATRALAAAAREFSRKVKSSMNQKSACSE